MSNKSVSGKISASTILVCIELIVIGRSLFAMDALSVDLCSMGTIKPVVNNVLDSIIVYSDASSEHSNEDLP